MNFKLRFLAVLIIALAAFFVTSASSTNTTFKTGPFTVSVDLGMPCTNITVEKPVQEERLNGDSYTSYKVRMCNVLIDLARFDRKTDFSEIFNAKYITKQFIVKHADKETITVYDRKVNLNLGVVGYGYIPKEDLTLYIAGFVVSPKSGCFIVIEENLTTMDSVLKTIKVTEA